MKSQSYALVIIFNNNSCSKITLKLVKVKWMLKVDQQLNLQSTIQIFSLVDSSNQHQQLQLRLTVQLPINKTSNTKVHLHRTIFTWTHKTFQLNQHQANKTTRLEVVALFIKEETLLLKWIWWAWWEPVAVEVIIIRGRLLTCLVVKMKLLIPLLLWGDLQQIMLRHLRLMRLGLDLWVVNLLFILQL